MMRRPITAAFLGIVASLAIATSALAHECVNASKSDQAAGAHALIDTNTGEILWMTEANRLAQGVVDPVTGEGLHGLIASMPPATASPTSAPGSRWDPTARSLWSRSSADRRAGA
jgi:hypothetical protein